MGQGVFPRMCLVDELRYFSLIIIIYIYIYVQSDSANGQSTLFRHL